MPTTPDQILSNYYARAGARLREIVLHPNGKTDRARAFNQSRAAVLIGQVRQLQRDMKVVAAKVVGDQIGRAYRQGREQARKQVIEAGIYDPDNKLLKGSFSLVDSAIAKLLARDTAADLNRAADSMGKNAERILRKTGQQLLSEADINIIIAGGIIEGKPRGAIRELREEFKRAGNGQFVTVIDKNGDPINFEPGYYAKMVIVTKTREAVVTSRHERLGELGLDLVMVIGKPSNNFCSAFLGQVFSLSGNHPKYPAYDELPDGGPPFHPNCSKGTRPFVEALASAKQLEVADGVADSQKLLGMDPAQAQRAFKDLQLRTQVEQQYKRITPVAGRKTE